MNRDHSGIRSMDEDETCSSHNHDHLIEVPLHQQQEDNQKMDLQHGGCRCLGKPYAVILLAGYTLVMGFIFLSYLYTLDVSGSNNKSPSKDIIILRKDSIDGFQAEDGEVMSKNTEGKLLVHISYPEKRKPASVMHHYKSMETGEGFNKKCKKCALISSSGHLKDSKAGQQIDDFPCVIRMNNAPIVGYTEDIGTKTTVRVVCHMSTETVRAEGEDLLGENAKEIGAQPENVMYFGLATPNHGWAKAKAETLKKEYPDINYYILDQVGEMQTDLIFEKETGKSKADTSTWLSTGWYTFLLALDMCEEISMYGFVSENYCSEHPDSNIRYHYFQSWDIPTECQYYKSHEDDTFIGGHRFITEKAIFNRWAAMYNVTFRYPEWTPSTDLSQPIDTPFVTRKEEKGALVRLFERFIRWGFGTMM